MKLNNLTSIKLIIKIMKPPKRFNHTTKKNKEDLIIQVQSKIKIIKINMKLFTDNKINMNLITTRKAITK